jgi:hypothetical protein
MERVLKCEEVDWMYLAYDKNQWWTFMNAVTLGFCKRWGIS